MPKACGNYMLYYVVCGWIGGDRQGLRTPQATSARCCAGLALPPGRRLTERRLGWGYTPSGLLKFRMWEFTESQQMAF